MKEKCDKRIGAGEFVTQNSGQASCIPPESSDTSKTTVPGAAGDTERLPRVHGERGDGAVVAVFSDQGRNGDVGVVVDDVVQLAVADFDVRLDRDARGENGTPRSGGSEAPASY